MAKSLFILLESCYKWNSDCYYFHHVSIENYIFPEFYTLYTNSVHYMLKSPSMTYFWISHVNISWKLIIVLQMHAVHNHLVSFSIKRFCNLDLTSYLPWSKKITPMLQKHLPRSLFVSFNYLKVMHRYILLHKVFSLNISNLCIVNYCTLIA